MPTSGWWVRDRVAQIVGSEGVCEVSEEAHSRLSRDARLRAMLRRFAAEHKRHREIMREQLRRLGGSSAIEERGVDALAKMRVLAEQGPDADYLNLLDDLISEQVLLISYDVLRTAADATDDTSLAAVCDEFVRDGNKHAHMLAEHLRALARSLAVKGPEQRRA